MTRVSARTMIDVYKRQVHQTHRMVSHGLRLLLQQCLNLPLTQGVEQEFTTVETDEVHLPGLAQLAQGRQGCTTAAAIGAEQAVEPGQLLAQSLDDALAVEMCIRDRSSSMTPPVTTSTSSK